MIRKLTGSAAFLIAVLLAWPSLGSAATYDILGREVPVGEGRPTLIFYSNAETRDILAKDVYELSYELREQNPIVVVRVDLRGVPSLFKGMAQREVKKAHKESVEVMEQYFRDQGTEPTPGLVNSSLFMVPDYGGAPHQSRGLQQGFGSVYAEVRDSNGSLLTSGTFPEGKARLTRAVETEQVGDRLTRR